MEKAFIVRETCDLKNWMIGLSEEFHKICPNLICYGSYNILSARLIGLSYTNYLKYCSASGGTLSGREGIPFVYFKKKEDANKICEKINKEAEKFFRSYRDVNKTLGIEEKEQ